MPVCLEMEARITRVVTTVRYTYSDNVVVGDNGVRLTFVRIKTTKQSWYTDGHSTLTTRITRKYHVQNPEHVDELAPPQHVTVRAVAELYYSL